MNKLDLAKVGKAFGFAVPPRVNISIGGGKGGAGRSGVKRKRDDDVEENGESDDAERKPRRENDRERRMERLGKRKVEKEVYRKGSNQSRKANWCR